LERSIRAMLTHPEAQCAVVATRDEDVAKLARSVAATLQKQLIVVPGGETRAHSVLAAARAVPERFEWVAVHDGARPLVSHDLISRVFQTAQQHGVAVPALPVTLTIKQASGKLPTRVDRTLPREELYAMQTPQIARRLDLVEAFEHCPITLAQVTDDVQLLELQGKEVWLTPGSEMNIKITSQWDLKIAELMLREHAST
jgi:2-C-methyl-D-erythritol 4-phosphate cytidylyltransferase